MGWDENNSSCKENTGLIDQFPHNFGKMTKFTHTVSYSCHEKALFYHSSAVLLER